VTTPVARQRIRDAKLAGVRNRLRDEVRIPEPQADAWIAIWSSSDEAKALGEDAPRYWTRAWTWILQAIAAGRKP
jgi:hypothetical protein